MKYFTMKFFSALFFFTFFIFISGCGFTTKNIEGGLQEQYVQGLKQSQNQNTSELTQYTQQEVALSFAYPKQWPKPEYFAQGTSGHGGFQPEEKSQWTIGIGEPSDYLGEQIFPLGITGFGVHSAEEIIKKLEADEMIQVEKDVVQNGSRVIVYSEGGICSSQNALIFSEKATVLLQGRCAAENMERKNQFEAILQSVSFLQ